MVLSLFATLLGRLWYMQVMGGERYQAAAVSNTVRTIPVAAPRGLIVDDQGRPLVANRTSWVVTLDHAAFDALSSDAQSEVLSRLAATVGVSATVLRQRSTICGTAGAAQPPVCWNGSPYSPVPVAEDIGQQTAASILEQAEGYPGITASAVPVRAYPSPYGVNAAAMLGYLAHHPERARGSTCPPRAGRRRAVDRRAFRSRADLRPVPARHPWAGEGHCRLGRPGARPTPAAANRARATPSSPPSTPRCRRSSRPSSATRS